MTSHTAVTYPLAEVTAVYALYGIPCATCHRPAQYFTIDHTGHHTVHHIYQHPYRRWECTT
jgi:hypothetical protein